VIKSQTCVSPEHLQVRETLLFSLLESTYAHVVNRKQDKLFGLDNGESF
jgi:hypothetical protein